jgi:hypothetical protein
MVRNRKLLLCFNILKKDIKITIDQVTGIIILSLEHASKKYLINY